MHPQCVRSRCKVKSTPCANDYKHFPVFLTLQTRLWGYGYRHMRSLATKVVRSWISLVGVQTLFITPGSPWENGYIESVNGRLRNELLDLELLDTLWEVKVLVERWRQTYNRIRPHSAPGYRPPAPEADGQYCA